MKIQTKELDQVNAGLEQAANHIQEDAVSAQEPSSTAQELSEQPTALRRVISQFKPKA